MNVPESTTKESTSFRYPSCSAGFFETVIVLVSVALPITSNRILLVSRFWFFHATLWSESCV